MRDPEARFTTHELEFGVNHRTHAEIDVLSWRGGAVRAGWWITTCERLFGALPGAVTS